MNKRTKERTNEGMDRRDFLKGAALVGAGVVGAGALAACSPGAGDGNGGGTGGSGSGTSGGSGSQSAWRTPPAEVTTFTNEYDYDVVVIGHGYAGLTACRELAESGVKVALIESQPEEGFMAVGNESSAWNSTIIQKSALMPGTVIPKVDPVDYYRNWMAYVGNQANPTLIMKFCQNLGKTTDWYYDQLTEADLATVNDGSNGWYLPEPDAHFLWNIGQYKSFPGTMSCYGECNQTKVHGYNREQAKKAGAEFYFEHRGEQLIMSGGKVTGVVASTNGGYAKFNCKAAIVATGGFSYNEEMMEDLIPDLYNAFTGDEMFIRPVEEGAFSAINPNANGDGVKMAYWAGAHLETTGIATMNGKHIAPPGGMSSLPHAVWVRSDGKRFCDEFYPVIEQRGVALGYMNREDIHCVVDSDYIEDYFKYYPCQHGVSEPTEANITSRREELDKAYQKFKGTWVEPEPTEGGGMMGPMVSLEWLADDTLEGLAGQIGLTGAAVTEFVAQIGRYNGYCTAGIDEEYGRAKEVLFPVRKAPFYATSGNPGLAHQMLCTMGGIITDGEQNALDKDYQPIPGLYVSGNDCGRRFGVEYITPTSGVSLAIALTLGREAGRSVAAWLKTA
jgi:succinate dehydrogenase/fumarate reductase flavoprotein subunit